MEDDTEVDSTSPFYVNKAKVVDRYLRWLDADYPKKAKDYRSRPTEQLSAITAEAVVWDHLVRSFGIKVEIGDTDGGPDFQCSKEGNIFFVEVKSLDSAALEKRTGLPNDYKPGARMFSLDNLKGRGLIEEYEHQLKIDEHPVVFALCSDHARSNLIFSEIGVLSMMLGTLGISVSIAESNPSSQQIARFDSSFWLEQKPTGELGLFREFPSAVLLFSIRETDATVTGLLHPAPKVSIEYQLFPRVPFCRFTAWPPQSHLELEWVVDRPAALPLKYHLDFSGWESKD